VFYYRTVICCVLATALVSYGPDEIDEGDDEDSGESLPSVFNVQNFQAVSCMLLFCCNAAHACP